MNLLLLIGVSLLAGAALLRWSEPHMLYFPQKEIERTPASIGLPYEEVRLRAADNVQLHGWFIPAQAPSAPTVLFFHGNAGNISHRLEKLRILNQLGAHTLIIDFRGYGMSEGRPDEPGIYLDAHAAYGYLIRGRAVSPSTVLTYGESLGSAVAVELAATTTVGGVVLEAPFTSIADVGREIYPFLPVGLLARSKYDSLSKIGKLAAPVLILHSRDDEIIPISHGRRLFEKAAQPKWLVELAGGHNDAFLVSDKAYREAMSEFLRTP
jgi:hypothetical protein